MARKDEIIARIQAQALEEFIQNGVQASSMEGIARAAKTTKRTLYKYYPNKNSIFNEIISLLLDHFDTLSYFAYSKDNCIDDQINHIINAKIEMMTNIKYVQASKLLSIELIKSNPIDKDHFNRFYQSEAKFLNWIKDAQEDGKINTDQTAELIANQFDSIIKGLVFHPALFSMAIITQKDIETCKKTVKKFIELFIIR